MQDPKWLTRLEQKYPDYDTEEVPPEARKPWHTNTFLWMAWTAILSPSLTGAAMAMGMDIYTAIKAILIGNFIISCVAVSLGLIGKKMGLGTGQLARYSFGTWGAKLPALLMGGVMFCWSALDMNMAGQLGIGVFHADWGHFVPVIIILVASACAVIRGISGPAWIAYVAVPIVLVMYAMTGIAMIHQGGGWHVLSDYVPAGNTSLAVGICLVIAAWVNGAVMAPDLVRVAKDNYGVFFGPPAGLMIIESINLFIGVAGFITLKAFGLSAVALALTGTVGTVAIIVSFIMFFKTNPTTTYTSAIEFASVFQKPKIRFVFIIVVLVFILSTVVTFITGVQSFIITYLPWVAATMTAVGGVIIADFWLVARGKYPHVDSLTQRVNWVGVFAFACGTATNMVTYGITNTHDYGFRFGIPGLNGLILAGLVHWALTSVLSRHRYRDLVADDVA